MAASETNIYVNETSAAFSANGNAQYVTVADSSAFYPGAIAWLTSDTQASQKCLIAKVDDTNHRIYLYPIGPNGSGPHYTLFDSSAYTTAQHAAISMEGGIVTLKSPSTINKKDLF